MHYPGGKGQFLQKFIDPIVAAIIAGSMLRITPLFNLFSKLCYCKN
jgi:hypothetical protein